MASTRDVTLPRIAAATPSGSELSDTTVVTATVSTVALPPAATASPPSGAAATSAAPVASPPPRPSGRSRVKDSFIGVTASNIRRGPPQPPPNTQLRQQLQVDPYQIYLGTAPPALAAQATKKLGRTRAATSTTGTTPVASAAPADSTPTASSGALSARTAPIAGRRATGAASVSGSATARVATTPRVRAGVIQRQLQTPGLAEEEKSASQQLQPQQQPYPDWLQHPSYPPPQAPLSPATGAGTFSSVSQPLQSQQPQPPTATPAYLTHPHTLVLPSTHHFQFYSPASPPKKHECTGAPTHGFRHYLYTNGRSRSSSPSRAQRQQQQQQQHAGAAATGPRDGAPESWSTWPFVNPRLVREQKPAAATAAPVSARGDGEEEKDNSSAATPPASAAASSSPSSEAVPSLPGVPRLFGSVVSERDRSAVFEYLRSTHSKLFQWPPPPPSDPHVSGDAADANSAPLLPLVTFSDVQLERIIEEGRTVSGAITLLKRLDTELALAVQVGSVGPSMSTELGGGLPADVSVGVVAATISSGRPPPRFLDSASELLEALSGTRGYLNAIRRAIFQWFVATRHTPSDTPLALFARSGGGGGTDPASASGAATLFVTQQMVDGLVADATRGGGSGGGMSEEELWALLSGWNTALASGAADQPFTSFEDLVLAVRAHVDARQQQQRIMAANAANGVAMDLQLQESPALSPGGGGFGHSFDSTSSLPIASALSPSPSEVRHTDQALTFARLLVFKFLRCDDGAGHGGGGGGVGSGSGGGAALFTHAKDVTASLGQMDALIEATKGLTLGQNYHVRPFSNADDSESLPSSADGSDSAISPAARAYGSFMAARCVRVLRSLLVHNHGECSFRDFEDLIVGTREHTQRLRNERTKVFEFLTATVTAAPPPQSQTQNKRKGATQPTPPPPAVPLAAATDAGPSSDLVSSLQALTGSNASGSVGLFDAYYLEADRRERLRVQESQRRATQQRLNTHQFGTAHLAFVAAGTSAGLPFMPASFTQPPPPPPPPASASAASTSSAPSSSRSLRRKSALDTGDHSSGAGSGPTAAEKAAERRRVQRQQHHHSVHSHVMSPLSPGHGQHSSSLSASRRHNSASLDPSRFDWGLSGPGSSSTQSTSGGTDPAAIRAAAQAAALLAANGGTAPLNSSTITRYASAKTLPYTASKSLLLKHSDAPLSSPSVAGLTASASSTSSGFVGEFEGVRLDPLVVTPEHVDALFGAFDHLLNLDAVTSAPSTAATGTATTATLPPGVPASAAPPAHLAVLSSSPASASFDPLLEQDDEDNLVESYSESSYNGMDLTLLLQKYKAQRPHEADQLLLNNNNRGGSSRDNQPSYLAAHPLFQPMLEQAQKDVAMSKQQQQSTSVNSSPMFVVRSSTQPLASAASAAAEDLVSITVSSESGESVDPHLLSPLSPAAKSSTQAPQPATATGAPGANGQEAALPKMLPVVLQTMQLLREQGKIKLHTSPPVAQPSFPASSSSGGGSQYGPAGAGSGFALDEFVPHCGALIAGGSLGSLKTLSILRELSTRARQTRPTYFDVPTLVRTVCAVRAERKHNKRVEEAEKQKIIAAGITIAKPSGIPNDIMMLRQQQQELDNSGSRKKLLHSSSSGSRFSAPLSAAQFALLQGGGGGTDRSVRNIQVVDEEDSEDSSSLLRQQQQDALIMQSERSGVGRSSGAATAAPPPMMMGGGGTNTHFGSTSQQFLAPSSFPSSVHVPPYPGPPVISVRSNPRKIVPASTATSSAPSGSPSPPPSSSPGIAAVSSAATAAAAAAAAEDDAAFAEAEARAWARSRLLSHLSSLLLFQGSAPPISATAAAGGKPPQVEVQIRMSDLESLLDALSLGPRDAMLLAEKLSRKERESLERDAATEPMGSPRSDAALAALAALPPSDHMLSPLLALLTWLDKQETTFPAMDALVAAVSSGSWTLTYKQLERKRVAHVRSQSQSITTQIALAIEPLEPAQAAVL